MFNPKNQPNLFDDEISHILNSMATMDPTEESYRLLADTLQKIVESKSKDKPDKIKKDTIVLASTNLIGILAILGFEQTHVIISKAFGLVRKV